jgi:hypothetical protein
MPPVKERPDFLVIGAAKSGTSALYNQLAAHPEIFMSPIKEPNFFALSNGGADFKGPGDADTINRRSVTTLEAYRRLFSRRGSERMAGEASTLYLYSPRAPAEIRRFHPGIKLIAVLRNPVDRAFSSYRHLVRDGRETETFAGGLAAEETRIAAGWSHIWHYTKVGLYAQQLRRYREMFSADQLAVFTYDRFCERPETVLREIFELLGVDPGFVPDTTRRYNVSGRPRFHFLHRLVIEQNPLKSLMRPLIPRSVRSRVVTATQSWNVVTERPRIPSEIRKTLEELYEDQIGEIEAEFGLDLAQWRS